MPSDPDARPGAGVEGPKGAMPSGRKDAPSRKRGMARTGYGCHLPESEEGVKDDDEEALYIAGLILFWVVVIGWFILG